MAAMSNGLPNAQPTPPQEAPPPNSYASYVPHDLSYCDTFEDSLIDIVLAKSPTTAAQTGIRIIPDDSTEAPVDGISIRASDVSLQSLPSIREDELPIPLDDPRRIFASPVPGVRLTHPGGYLEGGPGLDPEIDTFPDDFLSNHPGLRNGDELRAAVAQEVDKQISLLQERMRARQRAKENNEDIERQLKALMDQHSMEMKSLQRMAEESERKKEAREKRRRGQAAG